MVILGGEKGVELFAVTNGFRRRIDIPGFSFHGTRHTHLTDLLRRVGKTEAKAVATRAGHANVVTTLAIYQRVFEEDDRRLADLSPDILGGEK